MSFAHPWVLWLLSFPALLLLFEARTRGQELILPLDGARGSGRIWRWFLLGTHAMPALLLALAVLVWAGPQRLSRDQAERAVANIEFCLDVSGSMDAPYGDGTQYDGAMDAIRRFTSLRRGDAFGLTIFGNEVLHWVPLTQDLKPIEMSMPFLKPGKLPQQFGGTEIGKALRHCRNRLIQQPEGDRLAILVSDGDSADLGEENSRIVGQELKASGIVVFAIHVGESQPPQDLYTIAQITGGQVFPAGSPAALNAVMGHIDAMRPARLKPKAPRAVDDFGFLAVCGLGLLGLYATSMLGLRYTPW